MRLGIAGMPNVGKSTLFNSLTKAGASAANYPFCTIEPNVGMVYVPDTRVSGLFDMYKPKKATYASVEFFDIAGLVKGASSGEGLGNKFLSHIREVDAIVHVVRCFDDENVSHIEAGIDPVRDIEIVDIELLLSDIEILQRRIDKTKKASKSGEKKIKEELDLYNRLSAHLEKGYPARTFMIGNEEEQDFFDALFLLTAKPVLYVANISEDDLSSDHISNVEKVRAHISKEGSGLIVLSARAEEEISLLEEAEKKEYLQLLGMEEPGLNKLIRESYRLLDLISFFTASDPEVRAWTIKKGTRAQKAAGKIHSDFEKGFIRAEVIPYDILMSAGSHAHAREMGLIRSEGKEYVVKDGDVILFRFNV